MDDYRIRSYRSMPYYMMNPMQNYYLEEMVYDRDMERMKAMYPKEARQIQRIVEDECDRMEYEGSLMFDEVPDRISLEQVCNRIEKRLNDEMTEEQSLVTQACRGGQCRDWNRDLIRVLLFNEMHNRRCRHNRCRRWW